jgi:hypothetical protein
MRLQDVVGVIVNHEIVFELAFEAESIKSAKK